MSQVSEFLQALEKAVIDFVSHIKENFQGHDELNAVAETAKGLVEDAKVVVDKVAPNSGLESTLNAVEEVAQVVEELEAK